VTVYLQHGIVGFNTTRHITVGHFGDDIYISSQSKCVERHVIVKTG